jgi:hypothetical protein
MPGLRRLRIVSWIGIVSEHLRHDRTSDQRFEIGLVHPQTGEDLPRGTIFAGAFGHRFETEASVHLLHVATALAMAVGTAWTHAGTVIPSAPRGRVTGSPPPICVLVVPM